MQAKPPGSRRIGGPPGAMLRSRRAPWLMTSHFGTSHWRLDLLRFLVAVGALLISSGAALSDAALEIKIGYLREAPSQNPDFADRRAGRQ